MKLKTSTLITAFLLLLACGGACADPGYYVVTTYSDKGLRTVDFRYWTTKFRGMPEIVWPELGFGYGVTDRWYTELFASWIDSTAMHSHLSSWNWQNDYLLTQGEFPIDVAVHTQLIRKHGGDHALEIGPALQTDVGRTQLNFNVFLDRPFDTAVPQPTTMKYQWQVRHRWMRGLHVGLQGFGELGPWDHWSDASQQSHRAGPAMFGKVELSEGVAFNWQLGYLVGKIYGFSGYMVTGRAYLTF